MFACMCVTCAKAQTSKVGVYSVLGCTEKQQKWGSTTNTRFQMVGVVRWMNDVLL